MYGCNQILYIGAPHRVSFSHVLLVPFKEANGTVKLDDDID